jgi:hypothetical protein
MFTLRRLVISGQRVSQTGYVVTCTIHGCPGTQGIWRSHVICSMLGFFVRKVSGSAQAIGLRVPVAFASAELSTLSIIYGSKQSSTTGSAITMTPPWS